MQVDRRAVNLSDAEPSEGTESRRAARARARAERDAKLRARAAAGEFAGRAPPAKPGHPPAARDGSTPAFESIQQKLPFWRSIASRTCVNLLAVGLALSFAVTPPSPLFVPEFEHSIADFEFLEATVNEMCAGGYVQPVDVQPLGCFPIFVVTQGEKQRLCYDCTVLNAYLDSPPLTYETIDVAIDLSRPGDFYISTDITKAFWSVPVQINSQPWLGFRFGGNFYVWKCCPFGLKSSCWAWHTVFKAFVTSLRASGNRVTFFGDDLLACGLEPEMVELADVIKRQLTAAGLRWNEKKSVWAPTTTITYIGYTLDSVAQRLGVKPTRVSKTAERLDNLLSAVSWTRRSLSKVAGSIMSMAIVIGSIAFVRLKRIWPTVAGEHIGWDTHFPPIPSLIPVLAWWAMFFLTTPSRALWRPRLRPDIIASSDASAGGAGVVHASGMIATAARSFSAAERLASSTTREISTVLFGLLTFASAYARSTVVYRVDNQGVYYIVRYGSTVAELQDISERINELCYINSIKLVVIWVPRLCNIIADLASRLFKHDIDDWCISDRAFIRICNACGLRPSADLFADSRNTRSTIYYSRFFDVGTSGVDALTTVAFKTDGSRGPLYACPPPRVATAFISKLPLPRHTLLVVPAWISAPYYPLIMRDGAPIAGSRLLCRLTGLDFNRGPVGRANHVLSHRTNFFVLLIR